MTIPSKVLGYVVNKETYPDGAEIIKEGSHGDWVYLILEGQVKVKKKTPKGMLTISTLKEGAAFGELPFLMMKKEKQLASVVADGPVTVGSLDMLELTKEYQTVSPLLKELISTLAQRLQDSTLRLVSMTTE